MADRRAWRKALQFAAIVATTVLSGCSSMGEKELALEIDTKSIPSEEADALNAQIEDALESLQLERYDAPNVDISFQRVSFDALPGWEVDDHGAALESFQRSCRKLNRLKRTTVLGGLASRIQDWRPSCQAAEEVSTDAARAFFELAFTPVRIAPDDTAKITSYYEPELEARRRPSGRFVYPIYAKPKNVTFKNGSYGVATRSGVKPYLSRRQIYGGALKGKGLEIAYLADPVDLFYLQIQGSGRLRFEDGSSLRVGFAAKNGHKYKSAAQAMIRKGLATRSTASQKRMREYVAKNPRKGMALLAENPSYVFFRPLRKLDPKAGPVGALGVQLTPGRSIAVDRRYTPLAAPVWLESPSPEGPLRRLVVAQDTGSAILGAQRADYFWGTGDRAGEQAGKMNHPGQLTVLLPTATVRRLTDSPAS